MENKKLPNESAVLVLGILSIAMCAAWGIPGLIMGIVSLVLYKKDKQIYESNPSLYERSFKNSSAGKICAIIGVSLSAATFLFITIYFLVIGTFLIGVTSTFSEALKNSKENRENREHNEKIDRANQIKLLDSNDYNYNKKELPTTEDTIAFKLN